MARHRKIKYKYENHIDEDRRALIDSIPVVSEAYVKNTPGKTHKQIEVNGVIVVAEAFTRVPVMVFSMPAFDRALSKLPENERSEYLPSAASCMPTYSLRHNSCPYAVDNGPVLISDEKQIWPSVGIKFSQGADLLQKSKATLTKIRPPALRTKVLVRHLDQLERVR